jgi:hypothetical protein
MNKSTELFPGSFTEYTPKMNGKGRVWKDVTVIDTEGEHHAGRVAVGGKDIYFKIEGDACRAVKCSDLGYIKGNWARFRKIHKKTVPMTPSGNGNNKAA